MIKGIVTGCMMIGVAHIAHAQADTSYAIPMQQLEEVEVLSDYKKFQLDSIDTKIIYRKHISDAQRKLTPQFSKEAIRAGEIGFVIPGFASEIASRISGQKQRDKRLLKEIERDMVDNFVSIRYNERVVKSVTALSDDSAMLFLHTYPMPVEYARTASPLELKMWTRHRYKLWMNKESGTGEPR